MHDPIGGLLAGEETDFTASCETSLKQARAARDAFLRLPADAPFAVAAEAFDAMGRPLNGVAGLAHLFFQAHPRAEVRAAAARAEQELSRFLNELSLDSEVYARLAGLGLERAPDEVSRRLVEHALRDYRRAGVNLAEDARQRVRELRDELVTVGQEFSRNIASDVRTLRLPEGAAALEGLPDDYVASHPVGADGSVTITTDPTDYVPFMKYARSRRHREALYRAFTSRGAPDNQAVLQRLLGARHELAVLLGFPHWAAYVTEDKMIRSAEAAAAFIGRVTALTGARTETDLEELRTELRAQSPGAGEVREFDRSFLSECVRQRRYGFDARAMRPYFPYAAVKAGVLRTAEALYGLQFAPAGGALWHPDVEAWDVRENGRPIARFFLDMHPRTDKYKHGAMFGLVAGIAGRCLPQACLVCNFPRPEAEQPGLMEPREVVTFFHEFGHLLHHLLAGGQRYLATSGIATEWDFVEVPSQLFEEWARDGGVLSAFARHHQTGESIRPEQVEYLRRAEEYGKGLAIRTQMFYAALSLEYYSRDPQGLDTTSVMKELKSRYLPFPHEEGTCFQASFGHLDGYSALYYTYMWSLVLAKDIFSRFQGDLMNGDVARAYRRAVLEPGGSKDASDLVADFLGRPFGFQAFESWLAA